MNMTVYCLFRCHAVTFITSRCGIGIIAGVGYNVYHYHVFRRGDVVNSILRKAELSQDALLDLLAHATLSFGLVMLMFVTWVRVELLGFLSGDILAINTLDIITIRIGSFGSSSVNLEAFFCCNS